MEEGGYHMSVVNAYLGGQGGGALNERGRFVHMFFVLYEWQFFYFANVQNSNTHINAVFDAPLVYLDIDITHVVNAPRPFPPFWHIKHWMVGRPGKDAR